MSELYAGIDLGGTNIKGVLATADGTIVQDATVPTKSYEGPEGVLRRIGDLVEELSVQASGKPLSVGMGVPGLVDVGSGVTRFLPNLPTHWKDVPAASILRKRLGVPVYIINDVRMATLGELVFGHGRTVSSMVFFALGTGIGGGVVIDGKLRLGMLGAAGELGHQTIVPDGPYCGCGSHGCLETLASGPALTAEGVRLMLSGQAPKLHELAGGNPQKVTSREIAAAARDGDEGAMAAIHRMAKYLGIGIGNLIGAIHPELVVLGGGVAQMGDVLLEPVREEVKRRVKMIPPEYYRIELSQVGDGAGVLGAIALAMRGEKLAAGADADRA